MERLSSLIARMSVTATAPDGSVTGTLTTAAGLVVRLRPERLAPHGDASLSRLLSQTLAKTLTAARRATRIAQDRAGVDHDPKRLATHQLGRRRLTFLDAAERATGTGRSGDGSVTVAVAGSTGIRVSLRPRTVHHVNTDRLATAVNEAIGVARAEQGKAIVAAYRHAFESH